MDFRAKQPSLDSLISPFRWLKDRQTIDLTEERYASRYTLLPSGALEIRDVREGDAGRYRCKVESLLLPDQRRRSTDAELVVRSGMT